MASTYLSRSTTSGNQQVFTFSTWLKYSLIASDSSFFSSGSLNNDLFIQFNSSSGTDERLQIFARNGGVGQTELMTTQLFRDTSAWYHIVVAVDTTQATASDRVKLYVNGEQVTSFDTENYPSQNANIHINESSGSNYVGNGVGSLNYFSGSMAHVHLIDGTAYDASAFGETDATTGIWKPKTAPSVTYGTNGFFLKFENSGAFGTDSSGNSNTFTVNGTMTQTLDTPSNVFATMNPLRNYASNPTYSLGNLKLVAGGGAWHGSSATLAFGKGKWYWEIKLTGTMTNHFIGVQSINGNATTATPMYITGSTVFYNNDGGKMYYDGSAQAGTYGLFSSGDIMGLAVDMDAGTYGQITIYKNGVAIVSDFDLASTTSDTIYPFIGGLSSTQEINFGNGFFGTTAVSSAQNPDDGIGIFEYSVPTGYRALCTKSINAQEYS
jgi:hypothetical protein